MVLFGVRGVGTRPHFVIATRRVPRFHNHTRPRLALTLIGMTIPLDLLIEGMGPLRNTAATLVDYVYAHATESRFREYSERSRCKYALKPDNWINIQLAWQGWRHIDIFLNVSPSILQPQPQLKITRGRSSQWSSISIDSVRQLPSVCRCIEIAYYHSKNAYREKHGSPKRQKQT